MPIRVSICLNAGAKAGKPVATLILADMSTEALLAQAANKLRLKKKDVASAKLFLWCKDERGGTELPRHGVATVRNDDLIAISAGEAYSGPRATATVPEPNVKESTQSRDLLQ